jgi:3-hydroxybutyryl-CoA dehydrogenase
MHILIKANASQQTAFLQKTLPQNLKIEWYTSGNKLADVYFDFLYEEEGPAFGYVSHTPVFVNAVVTTTENMPKNFIRFNGWPYFWERKVIELVHQDMKMRALAEKLLHQLHLSFIWCPDIPGMIAARAIAAIINEAYFCLEEGVSSSSDIDTAMRLGTNYPMGPFEWAEKIGLAHLYTLLIAMQTPNMQHQIAPLLLASSPTNS